MNTNSVPAAQDSDAEAALISARRVLALEIKGLDALNRQLDGAFTAAVEAMASAAGRIVVTGMGKSGHIRPQDRVKTVFDGLACPLYSPWRSRAWGSRNDCPK
jgi:hypothetical protein